MPHYVPQRENLNATPVQLEDVFLMRKGDMVATCQLWTHGFDVGVPVVCRRRHDRDASVPEHSA
jgi:hypothetical protein